MPEKQVLKKVLEDYEITLRKLGETGDAATLHQLTQTYEGLALGNPKLVFELVADCCDWTRYRGRLSL